MDVSSLPGFPEPMQAPRQSGPDLARLIYFKRITGTLLRTLWFAFICGTIVYLHWGILSAEHLPEPLEKTIVGKWESNDGNGFAIEFTAAKKAILSWKGAVAITGTYQFLGENEIRISSLQDSKGNDVEDIFHRFPFMRFKAIPTQDRLLISKPMVPEGRSMLIGSIYFPPRDNKRLNLGRMK